MARKYLFVITIAALCYLTGCAPNPYVKAEGHYFQGDPATAEEVLLPLSEEETTKDGKMKNLFLWDLGIYRFAQGNYEGAIECFMASVKDKEAIHDAGETTKAVLTTSSSQKYVGDPVEVSVAYLYLGLSFYMNGDYKNALVALRRSIEEDLSKDMANVGDMTFTNYMLGECYSKTGDLDDAIVAYKRALEYSEDFVPAYIDLYNAFVKRGDASNLQLILDEIEKRVSEDYLTAIKNNPEQGITFIMMSGRPSPVRADGWIGAFRKRKDLKYNAMFWEMSCGASSPYHEMFLADNMHEHFKDQGGLSDEVKQQATRAVAAEAMKQVPILGLFAPDTKADVRYWPTMHGRVYIGFYPTEPGTYDIKLRAFDKDRKPLLDYSMSWEGIDVEENKRSLIILTSARNLCKKQE